MREVHRVQLGRATRSNIAIRCVSLLEAGVGPPTKVVDLQIPTVRINHPDFFSTRCTRLEQCLPRHGCDIDAAGDKVNSLGGIPASFFQPPQHLTSITLTQSSADR
jgi:hypothetical protein